MQVRKKNFNFHNIGCLILAITLFLQSDVYSFGIIVWEMWRRTKPYHWCSTKEEVQRAILSRAELSTPLQPTKEVKMCVYSQWSENLSSNQLVLKIIQNLTCVDGDISELSFAKSCLSLAKSRRSQYNLVKMTAYRPGLQFQMQPFFQRVTWGFVFVSLVLILLQLISMKQFTQQIVRSAMLHLCLN